MSPVDASPEGTWPDRTGPDRTDVVRVARILAETLAEGPGRRTACWVQGCSIRCPGCFNPGYLPADGGELLTVDALTERVLAPHTDGLTLLGGEPMDQAGPLAVVAARVRAAGRSVMTFTGFTLERLHRLVAAGRDDVAALLAATDVLVDGPYLADRPDRRRPWIGSTNQRFHVLGPRLGDLSGLLATPERVEVRVSTRGEVSVNGWADVSALELLLDQTLPMPDQDPSDQDPSGQDPPTPHPETSWKPLAR